MLPDWEILTPRSLGIDIDVIENGISFEENALIKAKAYEKASGILTIADDSGLQVDCLNGAPGIFSARYSPKTGATDKDRRDFLLQNLQEKPRPWIARFYCAVAVIIPNSEPKFFHGTCEGEIIPEERGTGGFGYDPIFFVQNFKQTLAEMTSEGKNDISHRGKAMKQVSKFLKSINPDQIINH